MPVHRAKLETLRAHAEPYRNASIPVKEFMATPSANPATASSKREPQISRLALDHLTTPIQFAARSAYPYSNQALTMVSPGSTSPVTTVLPVVYSLVNGGEFLIRQAPAGKGPSTTTPGILAVTVVSDLLLILV